LVDAEKFIQDNIGLVHHVCKRYKSVVSDNPVCDYEDLVSIGTMALYRCYLRFDEKKGLKISTYAIPYIEGDIKKFFRDNDLIKFSRIYKDIYHKISKARLLDEDPLIISEKLELPISDVRKGLEYYKNRYGKSLDFIISQENNESEIYSMIPDFKAEEEIINNVIIKEFLSSLSRKEMLVFLLHYNGYKQGDIGEWLNLKQTNVSRIFRKVLEKGKKYKKQSER
jgi:RNA polymerase sporulation-specific sigma factor